MKHSLYFITLILLLASCNKKYQAEADKKYQYVEVVLEANLFGDGFTRKVEEAKEIIAPNDSMAYTEAYQKFCISQCVSQRLAKGQYYQKPLEFQLYDEQSNLVLPSISKNTLREIEDRVYKTVFKKSKESVNQDVKQDSLTIKRLSKLFNYQKDEFDPNGVTWIKPKSAPKYVNRNGYYCYFMKDNFGVVSNFRFRVQYYADDWLFFKKCQFNIDGKAYEYIPLSTETDHGEGYIWEWFDEKVTTTNDVELIKAIASASKVKIKFIGRQYHDIKTLSAKEIQNIKNALDLYIAMGGEF